MSEQLVPKLLGRPAFIVHDGCVVYLSVHDFEHLRARRAWKQRLSRVHPDHGGGTYRATLLITRYRAWLRAELHWYVQHHLEPPQPIAPDDGAPREPVEPLTPCPVCGQPRPDASVRPGRYQLKTCGRNSCSHALTQQKKIHAAQQAAVAA